MSTEPDAVEAERNTFPWGRAALLLAVLWVSLWAAGMAGGVAGAYVYDDRYTPEAPYSAAQLATLERMAPSTFSIASRDMDSWEATVQLGRTIARLEGKVAGTLLVLALCGGFAILWLWKRDRDRRARLFLAADFGL